MPVEILRDSTTRADQSGPGTPDYGGPWIPTSSSGAVSIVSNKLRLGSTAAYGVAKVAYNTGVSSHGIFTKITANVGVYNQLNVMVRAPSGLAQYGSSGVGIRFTGAGDGSSTGGTYVFDSQGSAQSSLTLTGAMQPWVAGDEVGVVSSGPWIYIFRNGKLIQYGQTNFNLGNTHVALVSWATNNGSSGYYTEFTDIRVEKSQTSYPNVGMPKMAYDRDGTVVSWESWNGVRGTLSAPNMVNLNDISQSTVFSIPNGSSANATGYIQFNFPEPRDIYGWFATGNIGKISAGFTTPEYSTQALGTAQGSIVWNGIGGGFIQSDPKSITPWRTLLSLPGSTNLSGVTFLRFPIELRNTSPPDTPVAAVHIYGVPTTNSNVHRVAFWHPVLDKRLPGDHLDMDDVIRGQVVTREFRIKNNSSVYTMNNIVLDLESLEYGSALTDEYSIKRAAESTYQPNTTITSLAPGAISEVVSIRRIVGAAAPFRLDKVRVRSQIGSLT